MKLSIITPSYKQLDHLKRCAASVADQMGDFELEHLIHDGAGGDDIREWAAGQTFADVRIEPDAGMYDAINRGFRRANGDIAAWLNCDEQYLPGALEAVTRWFSTHPNHDILFGDVILVSPDGSPLSYRKAITPMRGHIRHCFLPTYSAATFIRRRIIDDGHFLDSSRIAIADAVWIHGLLEHGYKAGVLNEALAIFTQTGENLGQSEKGKAEGRAWRGANPIKRMTWGLVHRLRKGLAGCYQKRPVSLQIYVGEPTQRAARSGRIGEIWQTGNPSAAT